MVHTTHSKRWKLSVLWGVGRAILVLTFNLKDINIIFIGVNKLWFNTIYLQINNLLLWILRTTHYLVICRSSVIVVLMTIKGKLGFQAACHFEPALTPQNTGILLSYYCVGLGFSYIIFLIFLLLLLEQCFQNWISKDASHYNK